MVRQIIGRGRSGREVSLLSLALLLICASTSFAQTGAAKPTEHPAEVLVFADIVLFNGQVLTADRDDSDFSIHEAVAVRDGKILAVGRSSHILRMAGPQTERMDLKGRTVVPGFIDSHSDNQFAGGDRAKQTQVGSTLIVDPEILGQEPGKAGGTIRARTVEEALKNIKSVLSLAKGDEVTFVKLPGAYPIEMRYWTYKELDELSPDKPFGLIFSSANLIANSKLMALAFAKGLSRDMFGVVKDESGQPNGQFFQKANGFIANNLRPYPTDLEALANGLRTVQDDYLRAGVTSVIGHATGLDFVVLNDMYNRGEVKLRFYPAMDMRILPDVESYVRRLGNLVGFSLGGMVTIPGAHVTHPDVSAPFPEGMWTRTRRNVIPEIPTLRADKEGYGENMWAQPSWTGKRWEDLSLDEKMATDWGTVLVLRKYGWNIAGVHNTGSRAIELFLDLFETGENNTENLVARSKPHAIDHNIVWDENTLALATRLKDDVRFSLKYEAFLQRSIDGRADVTYAQYGELLHNMQPVREMLDNGIQFNLEGGDVSRVPPLKRIQWYVTRQDDKGRTWGLRHALDRKLALLATTRWAARYMGEEKRIGSIAPGMWADLVVLGGDFLKTPANKLASLPIEVSIVAGEVAYRKQ